MPYRRLPNTDTARLRALNAAYIKGKELHPFQLAYSQSTFTKVELFINSFEKAMAHYKSAYSIQVEKSKDFNTIMKKARLYLSHFIQVLNMAIERSDLPSKIRTSFGLDQDEKKTPSLSTEKELIEWGKRIIAAETDRIKQNQAPITNPTIAVVKVRFENFIDAYNYQKILQQNTQRYLSELNTLREKADEIILNIWNEVEDKLKDLPDEAKREKAAEYGVVYFYRKNEIKGLQLFERTLFDMATP